MNNNLSYENEQLTNKLRNEYFGFIQKERKTMTKEQKERVERIGIEMQESLDQQFDQWGMGLPFKAVLSNKYHDAKKLEMTVTQLGNLLEKLGYIQVMRTMSGARYVFSTNSKLTPNEMLNSIYEQEKNRKLLKEKMNE